MTSPVRYHWPNGVIPYTIDAAFSSRERAIIAGGFQSIHDNTCIRYDVYRGTCSLYRGV